VSSVAHLIFASYFANLAANLANLANLLHCLVHALNFAASVGDEAASLFDGGGKLPPDSKAK
jgi:hypothetical protein